MDLIARDLQAPANIALNRYLTERGRGDDLDALAALPLFLSIRAAIRAKVTAARARSSDASAKVKKDARDYFALAQRLLTTGQPRCVAVGGLSGTGKSLLARGIAPDLAPAPGAVVLRSDALRKRRFGKNETEKLPPETYTKEVNTHVYAALADKAQRTLAAGHSVVIDAVFARDSERAEIAQTAARHEFLGLFLTADLATRIARIGARAADASDADAAVARAQEAYDLHGLDWIQIDASGTPDETLQRAKETLGLATRWRAGE